MVAFQTQPSSEVPKVVFPLSVQARKSQLANQEQWSPQRAVWIKAELTGHRNHIETFPLEVMDMETGGGKGADRSPVSENNGKLKKGEDIHMTGKAFPVIQSSVMAACRL